MTQIKKLKAIAKKWNKLKTDKERWGYVIKHKDVLAIRLDNDETYVSLSFFASLSLTESELEELEDVFDPYCFDSYIGNGAGVGELLSVIGVESSGV